MFGLFGGAIPFALGLVAERFGLGAALWLLLLAPIVLLLGVLRVPRQTNFNEPSF